MVVAVKGILATAFIASVLLFSACRFVEELTCFGDCVVFEGASMAPTFCDGDLIKLKGFDGELERWQIVHFKLPWDLEREFIQRVVGLPGETIEVRANGEIYVDGKVLEGDIYPAEKANYAVAPEVIPADEYYVLGDNRRSSFDSRSFALVSGGKPTIHADYMIGERSAGKHGSCES